MQRWYFNNRVKREEEQQNNNTKKNRKKNSQTVYRVLIEGCSLRRGTDRPPAFKLPSLPKNIPPQDPFVPKVFSTQNACLESWLLLWFETAIRAISIACCMQERQQQMQQQSIPNTSCVCYYFPLSTAVPTYRIILSAPLSHEICSNGTKRISHREIFLRLFGWSSAC